MLQVSFNSLQTYVPHQSNGAVKNNFCDGDKANSECAVEEWMQYLNSIVISHKTLQTIISLGIIVSMHCFCLCWSRCCIQCMFTNYMCYRCINCVFQFLYCACFI